MLEWSCNCVQPSVVMLLGLVTTACLVLKAGSQSN